VDGRQPRYGCRRLAADSEEGIGCSVGCRTPRRSKWPSATAGSMRRRSGRASTPGCNGSRRAGRRASGQKSIARETAALIKAGGMKPAGLEQVEMAKKDGRWDAAYDSPRGAEVPEDLQAALNRNTRARAFFATLDRANRYAVLFRIQTAKKAETRERRIRDYVEMLARHGKTPSMTLGACGPALNRSSDYSRPRCRTCVKCNKSARLR
jgi:hypothetical protein